MFAYGTDQRSACCNALIVERPHTDCFAGYMPSFACYRCNRSVGHPRARMGNFEHLDPPCFFEPSYVVDSHPRIADLLLCIQSMTDPSAELEFRVIKERDDKK